MSDLTTIPAPGVHDLTDEEYFAGALARTSLSSTGVRELLVAPAKFRWNQLHPRPPKRAFDVGHGFHSVALGKGGEVVLFPGTGKNPEAWQKEDDKTAVAAMRAEGKVPLRPADWIVVHDMTAALRSHPHAPKLLTGGEAEKTLVWVDDATGVLCRAKADWLRPDGIVDCKSCDKADDGSLTKSVWNFGYYVQAAFYLRGFRACFPGVEPFFAFISTEKDAPYLTQVFQLSDRALAYGDRKCAEALEIYRDCLAADVWPGYPTNDITEIDLPGWVRTEEYS
jgi:hypothetical protein